jgi:uncharacterized protein DUF6134
MFRSMLILFALGPVLRAEERKFHVSIDDKSAGRFAVTCKSLADDVTELRATIDVSDSAISLSKCEATERWRGRCLVRLEGSETGNGRKESTTLASGKDGYALKAGAKEVLVRGDVWPTTFWIKPAAEKVLIVDVLTGEVSRGKLDKVGPEEMQVDGKLLRVTKYRLTFGGTTTELWYDQTERLTRRKWNVNGRTIVMELIGIKSD